MASDPSVPLTDRDGELTGCLHCGLPVPPSLRTLDPEERFCCHGCRTVYDFLHQANLSEFYAVREQLGELPWPARVSEHTFGEFDSDTFYRLYVRTASSGSATVSLYLEGVHCAACVWLIERLPRVEPGCLEARLDFARSRATLVFDPNTVRLSRLARLLDSLGYPPHPWRGEEISRVRQEEARQLMMRMGVAAASSMNVMFIAIALYAGDAWGLEPDLRVLFRYASLIISIPAVAYSARVFFSGALASLRARVLHMDLPLSVGILVGFFVSAWRVWQGEGHIYFDSVTMVIVLLLVSRWYQRKGHRAAGEASELIHALTPSRARRLVGDSTEDVPVEALCPGERVEVRTGESIPADGLVEQGESRVDVSLLTGESRPQLIKAGERVYAGTVNLSSRIVMRLEKTGEETRVGRLVRLMEEAAQRKAPVVQLADKLTGYFVAMVLILAVVTLLYWLPRDTDAALQNVLALLIVSCPCALGLATPVALAVAIGRAARRGILIKGADAVERLAGVRRVCLDKTGTLTEGGLAMANYQGSELGRSLLVSLELHSSHPLAKATLQALEEVPRVEVYGVTEVLGSGLQGLFRGEIVRVGSVAFQERAGIRAQGSIEERLSEVLADSLTPVLISVGRRLEGIAAYGDPIRPEAKQALARLTSMGLTAEVLSGDHPDLVEAVGLSLGVQKALGGLSPEEKLARVEHLSRSETVLMVGDGVNDAAALRAATVGIAVHGGAEASLAAADVFLTHPGLIPIVEAVEGARATFGVIRRNLLFSGLYNLSAALLAVMGLMNPLVAALLMPVSSLTVVFSSLGRRNFRVEDR